MSDLKFEGHFRDLFEHTSDLIHFAKIDGAIEMVNPAWLRAMEFELYQVLGRSIHEFVHPDYMELFKSFRENVIKNNTTGNVEVAFVSQSGRQIYGEAQIGCSYYKSEPVYTRCVFRDFTERKVADKKVEESQRRLNAFFQSAPDAIIIINADQKIQDWNPKAEQIFGFTAEEAKGKYIYDTIIPEQYRNAHKTGFERYLKDGIAHIVGKTVEITASNKAGTEFYVNLSISNVALEGEQLFIAFLSDISERKKTEEALIKKEAELMQSRLQQEKKDEFANIASHELKTPITTIKAYTDLAIAYTKEKYPPEIKGYLIKTRDSVVSLNRLINELLDVTRINAGRLKLSTMKVEMDRFLTECIASLQHIVPDHKIVLVHNDAGAVDADPARLEQVMTNLLSNAAKYSPGTDTIKVSSNVKDGHVTVSVKDYGIGIPPDKLEKIFTRFYRVEETEKKYSGLGIGLFICAEIIKQHNGHIWVESKEGQGSKFCFTLPLV
jgi:two-component system, LuxR family, sensor kinase FixL